jgi:PT repeat/Subtilase family
MKVYIEALLTTLLFSAYEASANHVRSVPAQGPSENHHFFPHRALQHHEVHNIISSFNAQNPPRSLHPKFGSQMEQVVTSSDTNQKFSVDVVFANPMTKEQAQTLLKPIGATIQVLGCFHTSCSISVSIKQLAMVAELDDVKLIQYSEPMSHMIQETQMPERQRNLVGAVNTLGDTAIFANRARAKYSVNGSGILIGILGDSFNCYGGYANDTRTGDLPLNVTELTIFNVTQCAQISLGVPIDQSRAVMQIIYDVAPGTRFAFKSSAGGFAAMAAGFLELAAIGCDIIVPLGYYTSEPFFQESIIGQAAAQVAAQGVSLFQGAGEFARTAWDAPSGFVPVSVNETSFNISGTNATTVYHQFGTDTNGKPIISQRIAIQNLNIPVGFAIQWDEPYFSVSGPPGCQVDLDIYFLLNNTVVARSRADNIGRNPYEFILFQPNLFTNVTGAYVTVDMVIENYQGISPKKVKVIPFAPVVDVRFEFATNTPTITGVRNSKAIAGVGAAPFFQTPAFGVSPPVLQFFSSVGGVPIIFDKFGNRTAQPEIAKVPNFVGPDSVQTTFYTNGPQGLYYGTPCAAAHVAGVAALIMQKIGIKRFLKPSDLYGILERTAIDMNDNFTVGFDTGFDFATGYGLVNASAALDAAIAFTKAPTKSPTKAPTKAPTNAPTNAPTEYPTEAPTNCGLFGWNFFCPFRCGFFKRLLGIGGC